MNTPNDGGPAFPGKTLTYPRGNGFIEEQPTQGMSLRDYFAGKALAGLSNQYAAQGGTNTYDAIAHATLLSEHSYHIADAMLSAKEREAAPQLLGLGNESELCKMLESLIDHCLDMERTLTNDLHHVDFSGESIVLCKARAMLAARKEGRA